MEGKWQELPKQISDDMLDEWAVVSTYEELPVKLKEKATGSYNSILLDLPAALRKEEDLVAEIVRKLQQD